MKLTIDMHVHTNISPDSRHCLADISYMCKARGIDAVCVTDHDKSYIGKSEYDGIYFYRGIELSTDKGHLLGLFLDSEIVPTDDFDEAVKRIKRAGGLAVLAHPYQNRRKKKAEHDRRIEGIAPVLDGIECENSRACAYVKDANKYAHGAAERFGLIKTAGSDAHVPDEIGNSYATVECNSTSREDIIDALRKGNAQVPAGIRSKRINTAKSQLIKLRRTNAGVLKYIIFAAFALRCILADIFKR